VKSAWLLCATSVVLLVSSASAGPLIYTPRNPNFGGSPFNGAALLNEANAQNHFTSPASKVTAAGTTASQQFANQVQSSLLSFVGQSVVSDILGPNRLSSGSFAVGTTLVSFTTSGGLITIVITDSAAGTSTTIQVPEPT
jgi:curli production assembly/transport component CsgF